MFLAPSSPVQLCFWDHLVHFDVTPESMQVIPETNTRAQIQDCHTPWMAVLTLYNVFSPSRNMVIKLRHESASIFSYHHSLRNYDNFRLHCIRTLDFKGLRVGGKGLAGKVLRHEDWIWITSTHLKLCLYRQGIYVIIHVMLGVQGWEVDEPGGLLAFCQESKLYALERHCLNKGGMEGRSEG